MNSSHRLEDSQAASLLNYPEWQPAQSVFMYPQQWKREEDFWKGRFPLCLTSRKRHFILVCGQSMPSPERRGNRGGAETRQAGTSKPQKALHLIPFCLLKGIHNRIREQNCNTLSLLPGRSGVRQGEGRGSMSSICFLKCARQRTAWNRQACHSALFAIWVPRTGTDGKVLKLYI